tara:strand:- start:6771 stop:10268 length:3498 start_codon:yes stop_codon:yes gene_type:complete
MLNPSDVYVSGGSNNLLVCWTDKVTKYDASSFYNWEQDNLPLHDLDERTEFLWDKLGHPTSSLNGFSFVVSADATSSCNPLYFTSLSACVNALPEVINYPILIEVASFGNLGGLNISNKSFGPDGALEIVNRNCGFASPFDLSAKGFHTNEQDTGAATPAYGLADAVAPNGNLVTAGAVTADSGSSVPILNYDIFRAKLFTKDSDGNDIFVASSVKGYPDVRYDVSRNKPYIFTRRVDTSKTSRLTAALESSISPWDITAANIGGDLAKFKLRAFDRAPDGTEMATYDVSTLNTLSNAEITWGDTTEATNDNLSVAANAYFNNLEYIIVNNCNGPIHLRNFNVDARHSIDRGIEIKNSKVHLERCSVSRSNKAGLYVEDSELTLTKGLVAYRNYEVVNDTRTGVPFASKRLAYDTQSSYGAGLYALNSTVNLSSTYFKDIDTYLNASANFLYTAWSGTAGVTEASAFVPNPEAENLYCFSRNDIGIHAVNSNIFGGRTQIAGVNQLARRRIDGNNLFSELNTEAGVKLDNSVFSHSGRLLLEGNYLGLDATNSKVNIDTVTSRYNQSTALKLSNSKFIYNKDLYANAAYSDVAEFEGGNQSQVVGIENGQDILCDKSVIAPLYTSAMPSIYGMVYTSGCFGIENNVSDKLKPAISINNGSDVDLIHAHLLREPTAKTQSSQYGLLAKVDDNSTLTMRGSSKFSNMVVGPAARVDNLKVAGIYAKNNSSVKIQGPTSMYRLGVDVLADDNSNIEFTPHQGCNGDLLVSSFDLTDVDNHTMVELHSTRACLVANDSNIVLKNLGDHRARWLTSPYASGTISTGLAGQYVDYNLYTSAGYMQFYPNGNTTLLPTANAAAGNAPVRGTQAYNFAAGTAPMQADFLHATEVSTVSTGGMCVRALGNSVVHADNVHFPQVGFDNCSAVVYDFEGTSPLPGPKCTRFGIWNIADNSLLKASYLSISGTHPRDAGFFGPSGDYGGSGAPIGTPDTSSLSLLDYYGRSTGNPFGKSVSGENFGAFRLYFSVDPATNVLVQDVPTLGLPGFVRQVFAQGYNFSGDLVASSTISTQPVTGQYTTLLQRNDNNVVSGGGFYYASSMLASPDTLKAVLEDSAMNTFANAKHNTVGKSGLGKVVGAYYDITSNGGDSYNNYPYSKGIASINNFDLNKDN